MSKKTSEKKQETKNEKFVRIATLRTNRAVKYIRLVGNCTGTSYEWTPEQEQKILTALREACQSVTDKFAPPPTKWSLVCEQKTKPEQY